MHRSEAIAKLKQHEAELKRLGIEHLYLFGSTARGEATTPILGNHNFQPIVIWALSGDAQIGSTKRSAKLLA